MKIKFQLEMIRNGNIQVKREKVRSFPYLKVANHSNVSKLANKEGGRVSKKSYFMTPRACDGGRPPLSVPLGTLKN